MNSDEVRSDFARAVKWWRDHLDISQEQLAERANLHRTYISDVERGARNLSLESISRLAKALEISIPTLFATKGNATEIGDRQWVDVLLVEDNPNDATLTLQAFERARFINRIHVARDGVEALDFLFSRGAYANRTDLRRPQVILLDLNLPKMNGLDVLRRIKADKRTQPIPVVVLTGSRLDSDIVESRRLGAETYIVKPVDFQRLCEITPKLSLNWALVKPADLNPAKRENELQPTAG